MTYTLVNYERMHVVNDVGRNCDTYEEVLEEALALLGYVVTWKEN